MNKNNYRRVGVHGNCCGICQFNQCNNEAEDICEEGSAPYPSGPAEDHVCDRFKIQPDSIALQDVKPGMELELNIDEPYRGNVYAGPYAVHQVGEDAFSYLVNGKPVVKYAPLRGYKQTAE
jgi:hypothetical protein